MIQKIFDNVFKVAIIRDDELDNDHKIERDNRRIRREEEQRAYCEEYTIKQAMIRRLS